MTYQHDPNRPPQSSGLTDVQVVEAVTSQIARIETKMIERDAQSQQYIRDANALLAEGLRNERKAELVEYAKIVDRIIEKKFEVFQNDVYGAISRYQGEGREQVQRLDSRIDTAFAEKDELERKVDLAIHTGTLMVASSPELREVALVWLNEKLEDLVLPQVQAIQAQVDRLEANNRQQLWLNVLIIVSQLLFWARAFGWLSWMGL